MKNNLNSCLDKAKNIWVPNWFHLFSDPRQGGFHERVDAAGTPLNMPKRLLTQCRQIIVYSLAHIEMSYDSPYVSKLDETFQFIRDVYYVEKTGGCVFSINSDGSIYDDKYDLYGHAFVLLACAAYYKTTQNKEALKFAKTTFEFIKEKFPFPNQAGFAEALNKDLELIKATRRQNPHMHLMEASIYMYEASGDKDYFDMATDMLELFYDKFLDKETNTLGEFFEDDLTPHKKKGHLVEAGHHAEWVWLLKRYQEVSQSDDPRLEQTMNTLFGWVLNQGVDKKYGGVFNEQTREGAVVHSNKRIWPHLEIIRATCIMANRSEYQEESKALIDDLLSLLQEKFIDIKTGNWTEILSQELVPETDCRPGTTPYHIFPSLREANDYFFKK